MKGWARISSKSARLSPIGYQANLLLVLAVAACAGQQSPPEQPQLQATEPAPSQPGASVPLASRKVAKDSRTDEVIRQVVVQNRQSVRSCYEAELKKSPDLEGTLTIHFVIGPKGDVKNANLNRPRSQLTQPGLVQCAVAAVRNMRFPKSSRGFESSVNYPFKFKP